MHVSSCTVQARIVAFRDEAASKIDTAAVNLADVEQTLLQMCTLLNGPANKKKPHELFGVLYQFSLDIEQAHKENAEKEAKVYPLTTILCSVSETRHFCGNYTLMPSWLHFHSCCRSTYLDTELYHVTSNVLPCSFDEGQVRHGIDLSVLFALPMCVCV